MLQFAALLTIIQTKQHCIKQEERKTNSLVSNTHLLSLRYFWWVQISSVSTQISDLIKDKTCIFCERKTID